jgi:hypothetical protein
MEAKTKTFWFIIIGFLLGGVGGGFIGSTYFAKRNNGRSRASREEVQKEFATKLKLTVQQTSSVDSTIESHRKNFNAVSSEFTSRFRANRDTLRLEIRKLLTPEQNTLYDAYIKEMDEREKKWHQTSR